MLAYFLMDRGWQFSLKFQSKCSNFHKTKRLGKCHLLNGGHFVSASMCPGWVITKENIYCAYPLITLLHKSHNAPVPFPTMHHSVTELYRCGQVSVTKLWDICLLHCGICEMGLLIVHFWLVRHYHLTHLYDALINGLNFKQVWSKRC